MSSVNKVILVGHLGMEPEVRFFQDGTAVANFSMATNLVWKDKETGEKKTKTEWHRIVVFRRLAEICGQYLTKGRQVYIEGRLQTREWEDKEGIKRYTTEVIAENMVMLGSKSEGGAARTPAETTAAIETAAAETYPVQRIETSYEDNIPESYNYPQETSVSSESSESPNALKNSETVTEDDIPF